ncbi:tetratricopeptide repeat protein [Rubrivirga sp.]|uniref:tetratricopeptide repeat protein n=1 Tax=Rubrivirga sp. TaxID=1885344 RepID=UPI003B51BC44
MTLTAEDPAPDAALSPGRRRAFVAVLVLLPVLFFVLLEAGLRLGGYGDTYPLFVPVEGVDSLLTPNREVARRYFTQTASVPTPNPDVFAADKVEGTVRIIAQGGSSAAGYPFYRGASFPQILGTRLRLAYPDRDVEVVNTAMAAVNSFTLLDLADEVIEQDPDAVVIYAGHNEFYGALGAASTESLGRSPGLVRAYLWLRRFRTVQLVRDVVGRVAALGGDARPAGRPPSNTLMARMIGEQNVPYGGEIYQAGREQFEQNLSRLLAAYEAAGIPVYVSTLASNEHDQRPFITSLGEATDEAAWTEVAQGGIDAYEAGRAGDALPLLERATALDTLAADPFFALGHVYEALGRPDDARAAFARARDLDALRFRAPAEFNAVVRRVAVEHGATVVEGERALRAVSPGGVVGRRVMLEHLHPNLNGYGVLADAFFDAIVADGLLGDEARPTPPGRLVRLVTPMDSLIGRMRVAQLTAGWPFRPEESQPVRIDTARTPAYVAGLARDVMGGVAWLPAADSLASLFERDGRLRDALVTRRAVLQAYPFLASAWSQLAALELTRVQREGRDDRLPYVASLFQQALDRDPDHVPALAVLGALALQAGDRPAAVGYLERAHAVEPDTPQVLYNLSGAYLMERRFDDAIALAERLVRLRPDDPQARALLAGLRRDAAAAR